MSDRPAKLCAAGCLALLAIAGCSAPQSSATTQPQFSLAAYEERYKPYIPATQPVAPVTDELPQSPRDAQRAVTLRYTVEIWEVMLPRDSVSTDDSFWKRVNEQALDLPTYDLLFKNGIRVGEMPLSEVGAISKLIEDRKGKRTTIEGTEGRQVEIPIRTNISNQDIFYLDRTNSLVGRSWENCDDMLYFSFESTPRNPGRIRISLTPVVRGRERRLKYSMTPDKQDWEIHEVVDESNYDATISADVPLESMLVVAPSVEARWPTSLGATFWVDPTPSQQLERLMVVIPHGYVREETPSP